MGIWAIIKALFSYKYTEMGSFLNRAKSGLFLTREKIRLLTPSSAKMGSFLARVEIGSFPTRV